MASDISQQVHPRISLLPPVAAFLLGGLAHAVDQALFVRAGPIPILITAPVVATLLHVRFQEVPRRRIVGLLAWGAISSGVAIVGVYLRVVGYSLPRPMTGPEMVLYDFGMFVWFVAGLSVVYAIAARRGRRTAIATLLLGPAVQATFGAFTVLLVETGLYA